MNRETMYVGWANWLVCVFLVVGGSIITSLGIVAIVGNVGVELIGYSWLKELDPRLGSAHGILLYGLAGLVLFHIATKGWWFVYCAEEIIETVERHQEMKRSKI